MDKKGLSMLEILVSVFILALIITGLMGIFVSGKRHIGHTQSRITSIGLARYFLDPLQRDVRQDQWGNNCLSGNTSQCNTTNIIINNIAYQPIYTFGNVSNTTLRRVVFTANWTEPSP